MTRPSSAPLFSPVSLPRHLAVLYTGTFLLLVGFAEFARGSREAVAFLLVPGGLVHFAAVFYMLVILFRLWKFALERCRAAGVKPSVPSAGAAVGRLFIPLYQFYWIFVCLRGLPRDLTACAAKRGIPARLSLGLPTAIGVSCLFGVVPFLNILISLALVLVLYPVYFSALIDFCRNLEIHERTGQNLFPLQKHVRNTLGSVRRLNELIFPDSGNGRVGAGVFAGFIFLSLAQFQIEAMRYGSLVPPFRAPSTALLLIQPVVLAVLFVALGRWSAHALTTILGWGVGFALVFALGIHMLRLFYGPHSFGLNIIRFFLQGILYMGSLVLMVRWRGVRWWTMIVAHLIPIVPSIFLNPLSSERAGALWPSLLAYVFVVAPARGAVLYAGFYFNALARARRLAENAAGV